MGWGGINWRGMQSHFPSLLRNKKKKKIHLIPKRGNTREKWNCIIIALPCGLNTIWERNTGSSSSSSPCYNKKKDWKRRRRRKITFLVASSFWHQRESTPRCLILSWFIQRAPRLSVAEPWGPPEDLKRNNNTSDQYFFFPSSKSTRFIMCTRRRRKRRKNCLIGSWFSLSAHPASANQWRDAFLSVVVVVVRLIFLFLPFAPKCSLIRDLVFLAYGAVHFSRKEIIIIILKWRNERNRGERFRLLAIVWIFFYSFLSC